MQARTRHIAILLLAQLSSLAWQYPTVAQFAHYGQSRYPKVLSVLADSAGNFLLLNLQNKSFLPAPGIQYMPGPDGYTIMVADFQGLVWNDLPKILKPANLEIESVRLGQFQENPPIFRISITTSNPAILKNLEFRCQPKSLLIKFPAKSKQINNSTEPAYQRAKAEAKNSFSQRPRSDRADKSEQLDPLTEEAKREVSTSKKNSSARALESMRPQAKQVALGPDNPPFRPGGLYLELGPDPDGKSEAQSLPASLSTNLGSARQGQTQSQPRESLVAKTGNELEKSTPAPAPDRTSKHQQENMPAPAPAFDETRKSTVALGEERNQKAGFASRLKRLFHKQNDIESISNPLESASAAAETSQSKADNEASQATANPQLEFSGTDPLKVKLRFAAKFKYKSFKLDSPPRFVLDLEDLETSLSSLPEPKDNPWLKSVRIGNPEARLTRIVFDLAQTQVQVKEDLDDKRQILMLTLGAQTAESTPLKGREVVLDAGHGGSDPGAQRGDIQEKEITLAITQKLKHYLEERGILVIMTRNDDSFVSLEDRARLTNQMHPDAFVSIHINSLETDRDIKGIETYYQTEQSRALADKVHASLVEKLQVPDRSVRKARFYVVNHTDRPAILAEVGFISNKDERDKLISSDYQAKVAESLGQGVILYLGNAGDQANTAISTPESDEGSRKATLNKKPKSALASNGQSAVKQ